jgi:photosystem II stability/assembly factor-like uncharacterized protein
MMKKYFYVIFISGAVIMSFGFRGCELEYCQLLYNMNSAIGRIDPEEGYEFFVASDSGVYKEDLFQCLVTLVSPEEALNMITEFYWGLTDGSNYFYCSVGNSGKLLWSSDGGTNWEDRSIPGLTENLYSVDFLFLGSSDPGLVVCGQTGTMSVSNDAGINWTAVNTTTTENLNSVAAINKSLFIVVGDGGTILKTYDQGFSWEDHTVGGAKFNKIFDGGKVGAWGHLWIVGNNGRIYATTDYGISWYPQNSGVTDNLNDIKFRDENQGIVVGDNGVVRYTADGGTTWQADPYFDGLTDGNIISLATVDFNTGLALVRNTTLDGGSSTTMFIVSSEPLSSVEYQNNIPSGYSLEQNYPNPFNPSTKIEYKILQPGFVTLKIYNMLGNEIKTLVNEEKNAGSYEIGFNATGLPSGIYFYKLTTNNFTETKKLVLMK